MPRWDETDGMAEIDLAGVQQLVGRQIISAHRDAPVSGYVVGTETLTLTLDDGSVWKFIGDGYDSSRLEIYRSDKITA